MPASGSANYLRLKEGAVTFRVLGSAIVGWEYWTNENKPVRSKEYPQTTPNIKPNKDGRNVVNHFWAFIVWDYESKSLKIMELTQKTIQAQIADIKNTWGHPSGYDLTITRKDGAKVEYYVKPNPPTPLSAEIQAEYGSKNINLEALYTGGDPFQGKQLNEEAIIDTIIPSEEKINLENVQF